MEENFLRQLVDLRPFYVIWVRFNPSPIPPTGTPLCESTQLPPDSPRSKAGCDPVGWPLPPLDSSEKLLPLIR